VDPEVVRQHLDDERVRLAGLRSEYEDEHLTTESELDSLAELSANAQHQADIGTETFNRERDLSILEHIDAELSDVEHALRRLEDGSYGVCEACGRPIGDDRLEAVPAARFCLQDQARAEDEFRAHFGQPAE
jgi:RNA polymerase-binding transcription factor DksA